MTDPLARHQAETPAVLRSGDANAIKRLYVDLGDMLEASLADDLDAVPVLSRPEAHPVVTALLDGVTGRFLDAGCGPSPAVALALSASPGRTIVALDIGVGTVRLARSIGARGGARLLGVVGDVERLPFRDGAFDGIVCDDTLEHLPDDGAGVRELARVLAARGRAVLATPNRRSLQVTWQKAADRLRGAARPAAAYFISNSHLREYTWRELEELIAPVLRVRRRAGVGWREGGWWRAASVVVRAPGGHGLGQMIVLEVERP